MHRSTVLGFYKGHCNRPNERAGYLFNPKPQAPAKNLKVLQTAPNKDKKNNQTALNHPKPKEKANKWEAHAPAGASRSPDAAEGFQEGPSLVHVTSLKGSIGVSIRVL